MSNTTTARAPSQNDRGTTASFLRRRPTSRAARPPSSEVAPDDSASNVSHRRAPSGQGRPNGISKTINERTTSKTQTTRRDTVQIRTRSPPKSSFDGLDAGKVGDILRKEPQSSPRSVPAAKKEKQALKPWKPSACLIPPNKAPLAPRISVPPLSSLVPDSLEPEPLKRLTAEKQEAAILDDLLFVFMGYEGQYIRFERYDPSAEKQRLAGPSYKISPGLDPSLRDLATSVLKMATYYKALEAFVEVQSRDEFGMINHALCASISKYLKEYMTFIAQLEHQLITNPSFSLHQLHLHTLKMSHVMFQLYALAQEILKKNALLEEDLDDSVDGLDDVDNIIEQLRDGGDLMPGTMGKKICKGGNILRLLTERLSHMSGDPAAREVLQSLVRDASRPYMKMLNEWLHHGGIKDPHAEFLIKEQQSIKRERLEEDYTDEYWEKRYTIRDNGVPPQLEAVKDKVLLAGKYLNVVRECGGVDISKEVKDVPRSFDDPAFLDNVNAAYAHANSSLLNLLLTTHSLSDRLRSMKHYFFLDRSDFFTYFLDLSTSELKKPWRLVNVGKLQSLLDLVLRQPGTVAAHDQFKEDVRIHMNDVGLTQLVMRVVNVKGFDEAMAQDDSAVDKYRTPATTGKDKADEENKMTGFEALEFRFSVPFPLSLVISSKTVFRYQILFRYLLSLRHLEDLLVNSWQDHNKVLSWTHRTGDRKLEMWKRKAWTLRARMLAFVQQTTYYCTSEVIEPNWHALMARVNGEEPTTGSKGSGGPPKPSRTVDELMEDHVDFLDTCLKECMLMNSKLLKIHSKLTSVCHLFATYTSSLTRTLFIIPPSPSSTTTTSLTKQPPLLNTTAHKTHLAQIYGSRPIPSEQTIPAPPKKLDDLYDLLGKYEQNFEHHLRLLLDALDYYAATETVALGRLCAVLGSAISGKEEERAF
ncbi:uncharacterized protein KY384_003324 [Bacidia gigantensis]|uniref:uncharacterized protein n=1 Tax=Bacidia gigantensis TaxID=2732470 RepID=UPI001D05ABDD|nr:uncharacterized protein KY384_003324 [Bacidia gigantensis]KAG8531692.1 hypothetical protein KY384_003324 [Bacidia gigantensis]